jgi:xanthine dehydrogenase accessory factor
VSLAEHPDGEHGSRERERISTSDWLDALAALQRNGVPAVLVTVVATRGSAPRPPGTHMVVARDGVYGTIGGGHLEYQAIAIARDIVAGFPAERLRRFPLGASLGQCCGGVVTLLFEPIVGHAPWIAHAAALRAAGSPCVTVARMSGDAAEGRIVVAGDAASGTTDTADAELVAAARSLLDDGDASLLARAGHPSCFLDPVRAIDFAIVLFGAGHVGRALVNVLADIDCRITWVDTRDDEFPRELPAGVETVHTDAPEAEVEAARAGTYYLVMTHDHAQDERLAERILRRDDIAYFGLIGSKSKRRQFEQRMARRGMPAARFAAMTCPIGVEGIAGKAPATIAVAVAAQLLQVRSARAAARGAGFDTAARSAKLIR